MSAVSAGKQPKVLLIGSSNVREGFRPEFLERSLPGYDIHNLAVGASNISQVQEVFALAEKSISSGWKPGDVVVLGIFYGNFVDDQSRWKGEYSDIAKEKIRYGLYENKGGTLVPRFGELMTDRLVFFLRPVFFISHVTAWAQAPFMNLRLLLRKKVTAGDPNRKLDALGSGQDVVVDDLYKKKALEFWEEHMDLKGGSLKEEQFIMFRGLARRILSHGVRLVVVDMPLPQWHRNWIVAYAQYREIMPRYLKDLKGDRFYYLDLSQSTPDDGFYDSAHPFEDTAKRWTGLLSGVIKQ
jgi:hypothetical protein